MIPRPSRLALFLFGVLLLWGCLHDWIAALRSPETLEGVERIVVLERGEPYPRFERVSIAPAHLRGQSAQELWQSLRAAAVEAQSEPRDFDGDGSLDRVEISYYHQEPMLREATSGMVLIRSGATGRILLGWATPTPLDKAYWCGDVDGNGSDDLLVEDDRVAAVLGRRGRASR